MEVAPPQVETDDAQPGAMLAAVRQADVVPVVVAAGVPPFVVADVPEVLAVAALAAAVVAEVEAGAMGGLPRLAQSPPRS